MHVEVKAFGDADVSLGGKVSLFCHLFIYTNAEYSWYCNCQKLTESQQFLIFYAKTEDVGKYEYSWYRNCQKLTESQQFLIFYAKAEDLGKYECEISKNEKPKRSQKLVEVLVKCE